MDFPKITGYNPYIIIFMSYYITIKEYQEYLKRHYLIYGHPSTMRDLTLSLMRQDALKTEVSVTPLPDLADDLTDEDFIHLWDQQYLVFDNLNPSFAMQPNENFIIPPQRDIHGMRQLRYLNNGGLHTHDFFEINYVFQGICKFYFKEEVHTMHKGELCLIAPDSPHDITISDEDSVVINIIIRKSTFQSVFFDLLSQNNLISLFFRSNFSSDPKPNYLLFFTGQEKSVRSIIKNLTLELWKTDEYTNTCCINWMHILLTFVLRHHSDTALYYNFQANENFSLIINYMKHHYQTLTLTELSSFFHYTEPYLSSLIKENTGKNYSQLIRDLRIRQAKKYLKITNLKIGEIAERIGYHSPDHFTSTFRYVTGISPSAWRQKHN